MKTIIGPKKIEWITKLRGLAILAIVLGHMTTPFARHLYAWHIPLLFFLSGYLLKPGDFFVSTKKDLFRLGKLYLIFGFLAIMLEILKRKLWPNFGYVVNSYSWKTDLLGWLWWMDERKMQSYAFVLWFLPALFWGKLIVNGLKNTLKPIFVVLICFVLWIILANKSIIFPFGLDKGLMASWWLSLGYIYKIFFEKYFKAEFFLMIFLGMLVYLSPVPIINLAAKIALPSGLSGYYPLLVILFWVLLFRKFKKTGNFFLIWGENSMLVYLTHPYINNFTYMVRWLGGGWAIQFVSSVLLLYLMIKIKQYVETTRYANIVDRI